MLDSTGAVLPGVSVTVRNAALNLERTTVTDADGRFAFRDLQPVRYELMAMLSGFETVTIALSLGAGAVVDRPIRMPIGTLAEMISVGCSGSPVASVAQPSRPGNGIRTAPSSRGTGPRRFQDVLERALQAIVPVAFAQQRMPVRVGGNIQLPVKVTSVNPLCPNAPIPATGTVVRLIGRIGVNGSVTDVKPIPAAPEDTPRAEFIASAVDAVRQWTFTPTLLNGQPTEASMVVVVRYQM
jgi:hypothetical protein